MIEEAGNRIAIRQGDWKYIIPMNGNNRQAAGTDPQAALYDLSTDPGESRNIIEGHPDLAASLDARLRQLIDAGRLRP